MGDLAVDAREFFLLLLLSSLVWCDSLISCLFGCDKEFSHIERIETITELDVDEEITAESRKKKNTRTSVYFNWHILDDLIKE